MQCEACRLLLDEAMEAELGEEAQRAVDLHLLRCHACAHELKSLETARELLRNAVPQAAIGPAMRDRIETRLNLGEPALGKTEALLQWTLPLHEGATGDPDDPR
ncbi:MAG: hypothetical protein KGJ62_06920 [Armatimonadetes bacterium]|nr:hypothetical protein [Armatimonadota bacterium]MDE2206267.1 hypothetical protein [Armatimonadota bacterium]